MLLLISHEDFGTIVEEHPNLAILEKITQSILTGVVHP
jgi:hypothetical protein